MPRTFRVAQEEQLPHLGLPITTRYTGFFISGQKKRDKIYLSPWYLYSDCVVLLIIATLQLLRKRYAMFPHNFQIPSILKTKKKTQNKILSLNAIISMLGSMRDYSQLNIFAQEVAHV